MELSPTVWLELYRAADRDTRKLLLELTRSVSDVIRTGCTKCTIDCNAALFGTPIPGLPLFSNLTKVCVECTALQAGDFFGFYGFTTDGVITLSVDRLACWDDFRSTCQVSGATALHFFILRQEQVPAAVHLLHRCRDLEQVAFQNIGFAGELYIPQFRCLTATDVCLVDFSCGCMETPWAQSVRVHGDVSTVVTCPFRRLTQLHLCMRVIPSFPGVWQHLERLHLSAVEPTALDIVSLPNLRTLDLTRVDVGLPDSLPNACSISLFKCRLLRPSPEGFMTHFHPRLSSFSITLTSFTPQEAEDWSAASRARSHLVADIKVEPGLFSFRLDPPR